MKRNLRVLLAGALLVMMLLPSAAMALTMDGAGNGFFGDNVQNQNISRDLYGAGQNVNVSGCEIGGSALLAGQNLSLRDASLGGSLRAAAYSISATNVTVGQNATVAAYSVDLGSGFSAPGVYAGASDIRFSGTCTTLNVGADTVTLNGRVEGDATIYANTVTIGENAVVTGTLRVQALSEPAVPAGASINSLVFTQAETESAAENVVPAVAAVKTSSFLSKAKSLLMYIPGRALLAVFYFFAIGGAVRKAGTMVTERPVPMLLSGFVALIVLPVAALLLMLLYVGIPAGVLLLCLYALALGFALSFCGCAVGQRLFPAMHGLLSAILGVVIFSVVRIIPYVGGLLAFASVLFTLGYFIQAIYGRLHYTPAPAGSSAPAPVPAPAGDDVPGPVPAPAQNPPLGDDQA